MTTEYPQIERKKMIISQLITRIELNRGYDVKIELDMDYKQFCDDWDNLDDSKTKRDDVKTA